MSQEYYLVNPLIGGSLKTKFSGKSDIDAAKKAYDSISEYFSNNIPVFKFTLQKIANENTQVGAGKISDYIHFQAAETKNGNQVDFRLIPLKVTKNAAQLKTFREKVKGLGNKIQLGGGKKKYDDEDWLEDSDDDDDKYFPRIRYSSLYTSPISYWYYDPYVYRSLKYWVPTFVAPVTPYIQVPLYLS